MHIFLTGEPGVGKSTALRRVLDRLGLVPGGFVTYYGAGRRTLYLGPAWAPRLWALLTAFSITSMYSPME